MSPVALTAINSTLPPNEAIPIALFISAVARKGKVVHFETQGFSDLEKQIPLQKDSLFRIYSMSKPITGVALMILLEEGKVRLNDPVSLYIPEFANTEVIF